MCWGFTDIDFSLSRVSGLLALNSEKPTVGEESSVEVGHTIVLGLPMVEPNTTKQIVAHCYPLRAPVNAVGDKFDSAPAGLGIRRRGAPEHRDGTKR